MADGMAMTSEGGHYNARITWFLVLSCAVAATGGLIFGYDLGISGFFFLKKFWQYVSALDQNLVRSFILMLGNGSCILCRGFSLIFCYQLFLLETGLSERELNMTYASNFCFYDVEQVETIFLLHKRIFLID